MPSDPEYASNVSVAEVASALRAASRVLVTTHAKPDGDALGSVVAALRTLAALGIDGQGWLVGPFEANLLSLAAPTGLELVDPKQPRLPTGEFDCVLIVDTGAWSQLETLAPWLRPRTALAIGLDHHARGDDVAARRIVDVACGSCTALLTRVIDALGVPLSTGADARGRASIAEALFLGLATDTGWFRYPNARGPEFALASRMLDAGVDKDHLIERIELNHRESRIRVEARALQSVQFLSVGAGPDAPAVALMRLSARDFAETGASLEETSGVVNLPMVVGRVRASALLIESEAGAGSGLVKISFRSKPKDDTGAFLDVNALAARFGGGGHVHAAGARIKGSLDDAEAAIRAALSGASWCQAATGNVVTTSS